MEKLSPIRASLETFKQFKTKRTEKNNINTNSGHSNPFGITFKGAMLNMDVFDSSTKKVEANPLSESVGKMAKFVASARVATINKFNGFKNSVVSFGGKIKQDTLDIMEKVKNPETYTVFNPQNSVSALSKKPVSELEDMLKSALSAKAVA
ncbi:hypothetical protein tpqmel_0258 [Candidatus Gastranaerophilus sp. (ex Termes propinquus)]|nr:hypothetical protein tpqmel_0258 [Candidatus Gastranaerophilus sp. (ex Termes propinquus)]